MSKKKKVRFNIKNVHYAMIEDDNTYGTPVAVPGAVSFALDPQGENNKMYADGIVYYTASANSGYTGDLEMADFPEQMLSDIYGITANDENVIIENSNETVKPIVLLFEEDTDLSSVKYALYNCTLSRPSRSFSTNTESKEPTTQSVTVEATPRADGQILAMTSDSASDDIYNNWYKKVYEKTATAETQTASTFSVSSTDKSSK